MAGTIVHVDVEPDLPEGLDRALGRSGFRLHTTTDTEEAFSRVRDGGACLVVLEVLLEDGRGWHLLQRIRALEGTPGRVPVVIFTRGEATRRRRARASQLGVSRFLTRPATRSQLLDAIRDASDMGPRAGPVRSASTAGIGHESRGCLADSPLPDLLLQLQHAGATGLLFLQDLEELVVLIEDGSPVGLASSRGDETFANFLIRTKRISDEEHEALLERVRASGESEADAAVSVGALSPRGAKEAVSDRGAEPLLEAFLWTAGSWRFERGGRLEGGWVLEGCIARLLAKGVMQWAPARCIRAMLDRRGALYLARTARPRHAFSAISPQPCEVSQLNGWTGASTVAEVLESGEVGDRELYTLLLLGLVETRDRAAVATRRQAPSAPGLEPEEDELLEIDDLCEPIEPVAPRPPAPRPSQVRSAPTRRSRAPAQSGSRPGAASREPGVLARLRRWLGW